MPASKRTNFISSANCRLSLLPYEVSGSTPNVSAFCMVCRFQLGRNRPFVGCVPSGVGTRLGTIKKGKSNVTDS
jgi:hypothetical protein